MTRSPTARGIPAPAHLPAVDIRRVRPARVIQTGVPARTTARITTQIAYSRDEDEAAWYAEFRRAQAVR